MNPEAGFIGAFREEVARIHKANPLLSSDEVIRRARGQAPREQPAPSPVRSEAETETPMEFEF